MMPRQTQPHFVARHRPLLDAFRQTSLSSCPNNSDVTPFPFYLFPVSIIHFVNTFNVSGVSLYFAIHVCTGAFFL